MKEILRQCNWDHVWEEKGVDSYQYQDWVLTHFQNTFHIYIHRDRDKHFDGIVRSREEMLVVMNTVIRRK